jgi:hypothetical protein
MAADEVVREIVKRHCRRMVFELAGKSVRQARVAAPCGADCPVLALHAYAIALKNPDAGDLGTGPQLMPTN